METVLIAVAVILLSGIMSLIFNKIPTISTVFGVLGIVFGCIVGLLPVTAILTEGGVDAIAWPWSVPGGSFSAAIDPLSAVFLAIIFVISIPVAIYGASYLWHYRTEHNLGVVWFFTAVLIASMTMVVVARNAVLFLVAWEVMSVSSFFLVAFENRKRSVRRASLLYLIATHIGAAFLLAFFLLMGRDSGSLDFNDFTPPVGMAGLVFILALIGFGSKAGFIPLHVWLPEAHPAAPSHISALLSGVMLKMGIYGLFRTLTFFYQPEYWWGIVLIAVGLSSGILGVLLALVQTNMKRLLAYSSVENMGIIAIGMGMGVLGWTTNSPVLMIFGFGGALMHCVNHAMFKSALFLAAGSVLQRCGTLNLNQLGGLIKGMPRTSLAALIASISIAGLPIGNGFVGEFFLYLGALSGVSSARTDIAGASIAIAIGLALIAGLAAVCFAKFFGIGFIGAPRSERAAHAVESNWLMTVPMTLLAGLCLIIGLSSYAIPQILGPVVAAITRTSSQPFGGTWSGAGTLLGTLTLATVVVVILIVVLSVFRYLIIRNRVVRSSITWDCGYAAPSAKMQYRGYSFVQIVTGLFAGLLSIRKRTVLPAGLFPRSSLLMVKAPDAFLSNFFEPLFRSVGWTLGHLRRLQHGNLQLYILYILITLLALMFWKLQ